MLTVKAAIDTYYPNSGFKDANWLLKYKPILSDHKFWEDVEGMWTEYSRELLWTHSMRPEVLTHSYNCTIYFDTIEHNLNMAIYCCALALNYVLDHGDYTNCECSGENPPQESYPGDSEKIADKEGVALAVDEFAVLIFFSFAGLASTAFALSVLATLKALEKYIISLPQP